MIETIKVNAATCDGCGRVRMGSNDSDQIPGLVGAVVRINDDGSTDGEHAEWYACRDRCIGNAARRALARDHGAEDTHHRDAHTQPELA